jgi:hypothetical protein
MLQQKRGIYKHPLGLLLIIEDRVSYVLLVFVKRRIVFGTQIRGTLHASTSSSADVVHSHGFCTVERQLGADRLPLMWIVYITKPMTSVGRVWDHRLFVPMLGAYDHPYRKYRLHGPL